MFHDITITSEWQINREQKESEKTDVDPLGCRMNVEDDLRSGRRPLQVASDPNPQLVDVCVLAIIRRDRQGVRDGQQLGVE